MVEDCLDETTLAKLSAGIDEITADPESYPDELKKWLDFERDFVAKRPELNDHKPEDVGLALRNIMELPLFNPIFADLICYEPLLDVLETLFQSAEFSFNNYKCIIKAPKVSSRFLWHRDLPYTHFSGSNLITAMLCLDDMTEENGATVVFPGSHNWVADGVVNRSEVDIPESGLPDAPRVTVCCPAGSAVLFHANIIHGGGANRSDAPRRNVIGIWPGPDCHPTSPKRWAYSTIMPQSKDPGRIRQMQGTFPHIYGKPPAAPADLAAFGSRRTASR